MEKDVDKTTFVVYYVIMETGKTKKTAYMAMKMSAPLKKRIEIPAKKEHRTLADQMTYFIEKGLLMTEQEETNRSPQKAEVTR